MNTLTPSSTVSHIKSGAEQFADTAAAKADAAIDSTRKATVGALDSLQSGVDELRKTAPGALERAAAQVDEITRKGLERAREAQVQVRDQVVRAGDVSRGYIKDEPLKSVLIAAATGAAVAALVGWMCRSKPGSV